MERLIQLRDVKEGESCAHRVRNFHQSSLTRVKSHVSTIAPVFEAKPLIGCPYTGAVVSEALLLLNTGN